MIRRRSVAIVTLLALSAGMLFGKGMRSAACGSTVQPLPPGFVYLEYLAPEIEQDIRYTGSRNFVGQPVDGYKAPRCILTRQAGEALAKASRALEYQGLRLRVYDCYRPQTAVNHFVRWSRNPENPQTQAWYYPNLSRTDLFPQGYIAEHSGHSRGSTVDLTLVAAPHGKTERIRQDKTGGNCLTPENFVHGDNSVNMGTTFDCFDPAAHTQSRLVSKAAQKNRKRLKAAMENAGFKNLPQEWWHFTLRNEPFPERYFDFPVE